MTRSTVVASAAVCLTALGWQGTASAAPCKDLPNPVIIAGSTAVSSLISQVAIKLAAATGDDKLTIVVASNANNSCGGVETISKDVTPTGACAADGCATGAKFYNAAGMATETCEVEAGGSHIDLVFSDVFKSSCANAPANANLADESLVVLPFGFIVPKASDQQAIDAREAYYVFGKGMTANVTPWINQSQVFIRSQTSGTQITLFKNLNIPLNSAFGVASASGSDVKKGVAESTAPQAAIGIVGLDTILKERGVTLKPLAYRHYNQSKFYWADSTPNVFDNKNVRDGHYPLWSYEHGIYATNAGVPVNPRAKKLADIIAGKLPLPGGNMVVTNATSGTVPLCAMDVQRAADAADLSLVTTGEACGCFYEKSTSTAATSCTTCTADANCTSGQKCRNNLCEAR